MSDDEDDDTWYSDLLAIVVRIQVEVTAVLDVETDEDGNWYIPTKQVVADVQKVFTGSKWTAFIDPDFEAEEMIIQTSDVE